MTLYRRSRGSALLLVNDFASIWSIARRWLLQQLHAIQLQV